MGKVVKGVFAAVTTPRLPGGALDKSALLRHLSFLLDKHIPGFVLLGATGEFCTVDLEEFQQLTALAGREIGSSACLLYGIGSASTAESVHRGKIAMDAGANGLLLPIPYFFPYAQDDVITFCTSVAEQLPLPILLYNLPQFTTGFAVETVDHLLRSSPNIIGIKDSSGSLDILRKLTSDVSFETNRILGSDDVLADALREGLIDGVISGIAGVLPELVTALFDAAPTSERFGQLEKALAEFSQQLCALPTPWGLKALAGARGLISPSFALPLSNRRTQQLESLRDWFQLWLANVPSNPHILGVEGPNR
jgi:4-hydroxy-tetrahydrodipicolinate synthase